MIANLPNKLERDFIYGREAEERITPSPVKSVSEIQAVYQLGERNLESRASARGLALTRHDNALPARLKTQQYKYRWRAVFLAHQLLMASYPIPLNLIPHAVALSGVVLQAWYETRQRHGLLLAFLAVASVRSADVRQGGERTRASRVSFSLGSAPQEIQSQLSSSITRQPCLCQVTYELFRQLEIQIQQIDSERSVVGEPATELQLHHSVKITHSVQPDEDESIDT